MPLRHDWAIGQGILAQLLTFVGLTKGLLEERIPATAPGILAPFSATETNAPTTMLQHGILHSM